MSFVKMPLRFRSINPGIRLVCWLLYTSVGDFCCYSALGLFACLVPSGSKIINIDMCAREFIWELFGPRLFQIPKSNVHKFVFISVNVV